MGARRIRREQRQYDQKQSRMENGEIKNKERIRRHKRLVNKLKEGQLPYTPAVMSWLSHEIHKPSRLISQEDVNKFLATQRS